MGFCAEKGNQEVRATGIAEIEVKLKVELEIEGNRCKLYLVSSFSLKYIL